MNFKKIVSVIILILSFALLWLINDYGPFYRLLYASLGLIGLIKISSLFFEGKKFESIPGFFAYLFFWPGVSSKGFRSRNSNIDKDTGDRFLEHWLNFIGGVIVLSLCLYYGKGQNLFLNYISLFSILFIVHMGLIEVLRDFLKLLGFSPNRMFDRPFLAESLRDFWSLRWNRAFVEMNKIFFVHSFRKIVPSWLLNFFIFFVSGILHEIGISYASGKDYGYPLLYFLIQGLGFVVERKIKLGRIGTILIVLLPFPLLFPPSFVNLYFGMLYDFIFSLVGNLGKEEFISSILLGGGVFQSLVLLASFQVPGKLNWKEDFSKLSNFNRKVFWTYGGYILCIIIFMAFVSIFLSFQSHFGAGEKLWVLFIILFWSARVGIDVFYYSHEDWPEGPEFVIGHICLSTLFSFLVLLYSVVYFYLL